MTDTDWAAILARKHRRVLPHLQIDDPQPRPQPLSDEARSARRPPSPADRVDIIEDRRHINRGPARPAFAIRSHNPKK